MQRLNNPTDAQRPSTGPRSAATGHRPPLGTAFFLFLGLAMVPISLEAAGVHLSFSPRLSAAVDAWKQVSEVFGRGYQPSSEPELASLTNSDNDVPSAADNTGCPHRLIACARDVEELSLNLPQAPTIVMKVFSSREARASVTSHASPNSTRVKQNIARATEVNSEKGARVLDGLETIRFEPGAREEFVKSREEFVKSIEEQMHQRGLDWRGSIKSFPIPASLRVLIRMKPSIAPTARRTAECKVRAAFGAAVRAETRQQPPNAATSAPDNCDL